MPIPVAALVPPTRTFMTRTFMTRTPDRLPFTLKLAYASGQLVELVVASMLNTFLLYYVTSVCGLPAGLAGIALGAGLAVDAIMGPLIGSMSDAWNSRFGRRVPFMVIAIVPLLIVFNLLFSLPSEWSQGALLVWLLTLSIALRITLSIFCLPYQALGAELSDDYAERSSIAAWRWGIGILGTVAVIMLGYGVYFDGPDGISKRPAYLWLSLTLSVLILTGGIAAIHSGLSIRRIAPVTGTLTLALHRRLIAEMTEVFRHRTFQILFVTSLLFNIAQGINQSMALHLGIYFWRLAPDQMQALGIATVGGLALAAPMTGWFGGRVEKRTLVIIGLMGMSAVHIAPVLLQLGHLLPEPGAALNVILAAGAFAGGLMFALAVIGFISIIPDAVDEHELHFGVRREGMYFAGWEFASKSATGAGLLISGAVLQLIDFRVDSAATAVATIPVQSQTWLGLAGGPLAGALALFAAALMFHYRLDNNAHGLIVARLLVKRNPAAVNAQ